MMYQNKMALLGKWRPFNNVKLSDDYSIWEAVKKIRRGMTQRRRDSMMKKRNSGVEEF